MLCELVLNGIGGHSIAQALENLSLEEFSLWQAYRAQNGSLNTALRQEIMLAQLCALTANAHGAKCDLFDFAPHLERPRWEFGQAWVQLTKTEKGIR